jgi:replicative DNA helicase
MVTPVFRPRLLVQASLDFFSLKLRTTSHAAPAMSDFSPPENPSPGPQLVPHSREAEESVIGAILINPEAYYDVASFLLADDFYIHRHRWIWQAYTRLHERRVPLDFLTVIEELDQMGQLAEVGGPAYLTAMINNVPTSLHAEAYGRIVEATAIRRKMLAAANDIAKLAYQEDTGIDTVMDEAEKVVFGVSERRLTRDLQSIQQVLSSYYDRVDQLASRAGEIFGTPTGFIDLDRILEGMQPSDFLIIAGRPGTGKTAFMLSAAKNAAQVYKKHVAIFSLEMSSEQLVQRLISQETGIDSQRLRTGKLEDDEWPVFTHAVEVLNDTVIFLDDTPALTPLQLRTKSRRLHLEFGLDLVIVDYLQLMSSGTRAENRVQEVSYISRNLKVLARELNVPVLAAAQLSRAIEQRADKEPQLSDLRESGSLEQDADVVMFIHRPEMYEKDTLKQNLAEIKIAKHRNGPVGTVELVFRSNLAKFENAALRSVDLTKVR